MTTPDSGADPHRDDWKPVPLTLKQHNREAKTFVIEFEAPKQLLVLENFEALVHDETLRYADRDGLVLEGQIVVTTRAKGEPHKDVTEEQDATVHEVLRDPSKESEVAAEQDQIDSPYKLSDAEIAYRRKMRESMRQTGAEALGFTQRQLDGRSLPGGHEFKVNPQAFMEGFFGGGPTLRPDVMVVRAEALVALDTGVTTEPAPEPPVDEIDIVVPDDLSGLDGLD